MTGEETLMEVKNKERKGKKQRDREAKAVGGWLGDGCGE
jgi:hypothetical protein